MKLYNYLVCAIVNVINAVIVARNDVGLLAGFRVITEDLHQNIQLVHCIGMNMWNSNYRSESAWLPFLDRNNTDLVFQTLFPSTIVKTIWPAEIRPPENFKSKQGATTLTKMFYTISDKNPCQVSETYNVLGIVITNHFHICSEGDLYQLVYPRGRRQNFNQTSVSIVAYDVEGIRGTVDESTGIIIGNLAAESTVRDLQFLFNFKVTLNIVSYVEGRNYSYFDPLAEYLNSGQADLGIGYFYLTTPRVEAATPLIPLASDGLFVFFVQPPSNSVRNIYTIPFKWNVPVVVISILIFIGGVVVVLKIILEASSNILDGFLWTVSAVCQSGYDIATQKISVKTLTLTGSLLGYSMYAVFSARLISVLVMPVTPVNQVKDLFKYGYTFDAIPAVKQVVFNPEANLKERQNIGNDSWTDSLMAILSERHAHIDVKLESVNGFFWFARAVIRPLVRPPDKVFCDKVSRVQYSSTASFIANGFYVPKSGSEVKGHFNLGIVKIREVGLLKRYLKFTGPAGLSCPPKQMAYQDDLGVDDVLSAFVLYMILFLIAAILLIIERFFVLRMIFQFKIR